jgi:hypothetical protein
LYGSSAEAVARCQGCDDVLFRVDGPRVRWVIVHLTYAARPERTPWPRTRFYGSFAEAWRDLGH